jgi:hypothetical protein
MNQVLNGQNAYICYIRNRVVGVVSSSRKAFNFLLEGKGRSIDVFKVNALNIGNKIPDRRKRLNGKV